MKKSERYNWTINIENSASAVSEQLGSAIVDAVFKKYCAHNVWDLNPAFLSEVFSELYAIEVDIA